MKLVINKCYGGFSLSARATARLAELKGKQAFFFVNDLADRTRRQVPIEEVRGMFWTAYTVPNPPAHPTAQQWADMATEERQASNAATEAVSIDVRPETRADPDLVRVVEELGDAANGDCAKLRVIEIPDGVSWEIDEYDGMESVAEKHRSWN